MSSSAPPGAGPAAAYFCHKCEGNVTVISSPTGDISCSVCHGGFVEEVEIPQPAPTLRAGGPYLFGTGPPSSYQTVGAIDPFASLFGPSPFAASSPNMEINNPADVLGMLGLDSSRTGAPNPPAGGPEPFQPLHFLSDYLQTLTAGGANIHFVVDGVSSPGMGPFFGLGGGGGPATYGDYLVGPGLEQLIQHLMENDPNRYGTPPASKSVIDGLPDVKISLEMLASEQPECAVCKDTFEVGDTAKQIPCKHIYHKDCIFPWLELHNSCPVCRYELPTDDPEYENRRQGTSSGPTRGGGQPSAAPGGNAPGVLGAGSPGAYLAGPRVVQRRFTIQLPWPFRSSQNPQDGGGNSGGTNRPGGSGGNPGGY